MKQSVKDSDFAIQKAEEGAAGLIKRAEELTQTLSEYEKEYQVKPRFLCKPNYLL